MTDNIFNRTVLRSILSSRGIVVTAIILIMASGLGIIIDKLDNAYTCPPYCEVNHVHHINKIYCNRAQSGVNSAMAKPDNIDYDEEAHKQAILDIVDENGGYMSENKEPMNVLGYTTEPGDKTSIIDDVVNIQGANAFKVTKPETKVKSNPFAKADNVVFDAVMQTLSNLPIGSNERKAAYKALKLPEDGTVSSYSPDKLPRVLPLDEGKQYADFWGKYYQTQDNKEAKDVFLQYASRVQFDPKTNQYTPFDKSFPTIKDSKNVMEINQASYSTGNLFDGTFGIDGDKLANTLFYTGLHESQGASRKRQKADNNKLGRGRGYWSVEYNTARDILMKDRWDSYSYMNDKVLDKLGSILGGDLQFINDGGVKKVRFNGQQLTRSNIIKIQNHPEGSAILGALQYMTVASRKGALDFLK